MEWDIGQTYYPSYTSLAQLIGVARPDWYIKKRYGKQGAKACASHRCIHSPTRQKELLLSCLQCLIHATYQSATCYSFSQTTHVRIFSELSAPLSLQLMCTRKFSSHCKLFFGLRKLLCYTVTRVMYVNIPAICCTCEQ